MATIEKDFRQPPTNFLFMQVRESFGEDGIVRYRGTMLVKGGSD